MADAKSPGLLARAAENPFAKLGSLATAIGAWWYVQGGEIDEAKVRATVHWDLPARLAAAEPLPQTVAVTVKGSRTATRRAQRGDVTLTANLATLKAGEHEIETASLELRGLPPGVAVSGFVPPNIHVVLDAETVRKVRVKAVTVGDPGDGFSVERTTVEPTVVEVRGPGLVLSDLTEVRTRPIDVSRLTADIEEPVELDLPFAVTRAGGSEVRAHVDVEPVLEKRPFEGVTIVSGNPSYRPTVRSLDLVLQGPSSVLREITADEVAAIVVLPEDARAQLFEVGYGPKDGPRINIVHPSMDEVRIVSVKPAVVEVVRQ